ncbi:MAG: hypothetical protein P9M14_03145, partial [Candidatus Alcyoniella australis]|nr:hypothetical protein [Candidatus Alcyoniella australis]
VIQYNGVDRYHWGQRHTGAAVALIKQLFPNPEKVLVAGSSAGGYGTFLGWAQLKSQFLDTPTYVLNDSGTGFWDPEKPEEWSYIKECWGIELPEQCVLCDGTAVTYLYDLYLDLDPQLRVGMISSYRDQIISEMFLGMDPLDFKGELLGVTNLIRRAQPERFKRFLIDGNSHTTYDFLLPGGAGYQIEGISIFQWIGMLVNDDPSWPDLLE